MMDDRPVTYAEMRATYAEMKAEFLLRDKRFDRLAVDFVAMSDRIARLESCVATKSDIERVVGVVETFAKRLETYDRESFMIPATLDSHGKTLLDHERRIKRIESGQA